MFKIKSKKIILTGPSGTGKTTLKKVYFEMANPIKLLESTLEPTRGINSSVYSLFNSNIGVFDLAGQENDLWLSKEKKIFEDSSIIICIFDIRNTLIKIIKFLVEIFKIKKELGLYDCKIILFLHKIDLVKISYLSNKHQAIKQYFRVKIPEALNLKIFLTSIAGEYFLKTYYIFLEIFNIMFSQDLITIQKDLFNKLKIDLSILLKFDDSITYSWNILKDKLNLEFSEALSHLERLTDLGLVEIRDLNPFTFKLTERAKIFKLGLEREINRVDESRFDKGVDLYYTFLNFKKKHSYT